MSQFLSFPLLCLFCLIPISMPVVPLSVPHQPPANGTPCCQWHPCPPATALQRDIHPGFAPAALNTEADCKLAASDWQPQGFKAFNWTLCGQCHLGVESIVIQKVVSIFRFRRSKSHGTQIHQISWNTLKKGLRNDLFPFKHSLWQLRSYVWSGMISKILCRHLLVT